MSILLLFATVQAGFIPIPHWKTGDEIGQQEDLNCDKFQCAPKNITFAEGDCSYYDGNTYYLNPCPGPEDPYCFIREGMNSTCVTPFYLDGVTLHDAYPGEICRGDADCRYGTCNNSTLTCDGKEQFKNCVSHGECNPGLRCHESICVPLLTNGQGGCNEDFDCQNNLGCNKTDIYASQGTCIPYFSVATGSFVSNCDVNWAISDLCDSGYCKTVGFLSHLGKCLDPAVSTHSLPYACNADTDCSATNGEDVFEGKCQCGVNPDGQSYCQAFAGDAPGLAFTKTLKGLTTGGKLAGCNTVRRFEDHCWKSVDAEEYAELEQAKYYYVDYPKLISNDDCVKQTWTQYYWSPNMALGIALSLALLAF